MLKISNLSKAHPNGARALRDRSPDIPDGMHGPDGAGESALMRALAKLQQSGPGAGR